MGSNINGGTLSLAQALQLQTNFWNLRSAPWGDVANADPQSRLIGPVQVSIYGAQIAHDSLIDRFVIQYQPGGKPLGASPISPDSFGDDRQDRVLVSRERPLMQPLAGPLFFFCRTGDFYDTDPVLGGYESQAGVSTPFPATFVGQTLSANLILKQPINSLFGVRAALERYRVPVALTGPGTEDTLAILPVSGRKHIRVGVFCAAAGPAIGAWRLSGLVGNRDFGGLPVLPLNKLHEVPLLAGAAIGAGSTATLTLEDPNVRFLCIKATGAAPGNVFYWFKATDE